MLEYFFQIFCVHFSKKSCLKFFSNILRTFSKKTCWNNFAGTLLKVRILPEKVFHLSRKYVSMREGSYSGIFRVELEIGGQNNGSAAVCISRYILLFRLA